MPRTTIRGFAMCLASGRHARFHDDLDVAATGDKAVLLDIDGEQPTRIYLEEAPQIIEWLQAFVEEGERQKHWGRPAVEPHGQMRLGVPTTRTCPGLDGHPRCGVELRRGQQLCAACNAAGAGGVSDAAKGIRAAG